MRAAGGVVDVQMGEHDFFHISGADASCAELRTDFLLAFEAKLDEPPVVRMKRSDALEQMHPLPGIYDDHAFRMIDHPCVRRQPVGPVPIGEHPETSSQAAAPAFHLR